MRDLLHTFETDTGTAELYARLPRREKEVAWTPGISPRTASVHGYNIFGKLNISSDVELIV